MATESPIRIIEASGKWPSHSDITSRGIEDLGLLLKSQRFHDNKSNMAPNRSGSAPPSIEGSFAAIENLMFRQNITTSASLASPNNGNEMGEAEEQLRADPAYFAYYWAHVNLNPRLPPPLISGENRHLFRNTGSSGNNRRFTSFDDSGNALLALSFSNLSTHKEESDDERSPKQDDLPQVLSPIYDQSRPFRHELLAGVDNHDADDTGQSSFSDPTMTTITSSSSVDGRGGIMAIKPSLNRRSSSNHSEDDASSSAVTDSDISGIKKGIAAINISILPKIENQSNQKDWHQEQVYGQQRTMFPVQGTQPQMISQDQTYASMNQFLQNPTSFSSEVQPLLQSAGFNPPAYAAGPPYMPSSNPVYPNMMQSGYFSHQYTIGGYAFNPTPLSPYMTGYLPNSAIPMPYDINASPSFSGQTSGFDLQHLHKFYGQLGVPMQPPFTQQFQLSGHGDEQKLQNPGIVGHSNLSSRRVGITNPYYIGSPTNMGIMQFPTSPFASPAVPGSPIGGTSFPGGRNDLRSSPGPVASTGIYGGWQAHVGHRIYGDPKTYSFLEELKSGKGRRFELSDIFGHIVEFSADQHGSRFIQQKLETCGIEEKESVFKEVLPHASRLMTDVFGNYVIQKFFEYGSAEQRRELGNQLEGQILPLSLQMYGCRVIQKALDALELDQKTKLVHELDGHVLRCVRDQNGNHVIQKCIESIPTEKIKFVISSFRGQVASLSTHPYGCRVIQRVLEHSTDELHCQFIVDEILDSVYALAQDQYGNYVTQHVLERGKPEERSQIIRKLSGNIVPLSQHKFASNVIEKCLEYGDSASREVLIDEIVGLGDGSDNLLAMVKDQFANYVVQKVLQTCTGDQREVLLGRIKIHLNSLKKYTYGKHIVARFEQLYGEEIQTSSS